MKKALLASAKFIKKNKYKFEQWEITCPKCGHTAIYNFAPRIQPVGDSILVHQGKDNHMVVAKFTTIPVKGGFSTYQIITRNALTILAERFK